MKSKNDIKSESESYKRMKSKNDIKSDNKQSEKSKNDNKSDDEDMDVKNEGKLRTLVKTAIAKVTAKADEVKALEKTLKEFRVEKKRSK